jgi:hypothetical protein
MTINAGLVGEARRRAASFSGRRDGQVQWCSLLSAVIWLLGVTAGKVFDVFCAPGLAEAERRGLQPQRQSRSSVRYRAAGA